LIGMNGAMAAAGLSTARAVSWNSVLHGASDRKMEMAVHS
jgi:hypothetical protein